MNLVSLLNERKRLVNIGKGLNTRLLYRIVKEQGDDFEEDRARVIFYQLGLEGVSKENAVLQIDPKCIDLREAGERQCAGASDSSLCGPKCSKVTRCRINPHRSRNSKTAYLTFYIPVLDMGGYVQAFEPCSNHFRDINGSMPPAGAADSDRQVAFAFMRVTRQKRLDQDFEILNERRESFVFLDIGADFSGPARQGFKSLSQWGLRKKRTSMAMSAPRGRPF